MRVHLYNSSEAIIYDQSSDEDTKDITIGDISNAEIVDNILTIYCGDAPWSFSMTEIEWRRLPAMILRHRITTIIQATDLDQGLLESYLEAVDDNDAGIDYEDLIDGEISEDYRLWITYQG